MPEVTTPERKRRVRRNYERELFDLQRYAQVSVEVITALAIDNDFMKGQLAALNAVLKRLEGK